MNLYTIIFLLFFVDNVGELRQTHFSRGAVAQLGERLNGIQEVKSSILFSSTRSFKLNEYGIELFFLESSLCIVCYSCSSSAG